MNLLVLFITLCFIKSFSYANPLTPMYVNRTWKSFTGANTDIIQLVEVHNITGDVFVAATNVIYHLDADLRLKESVSTGPELDHPDCLHVTYPCEYKRIMKDNVPYAMKIVYHMESEMLILCGSLYNGLCQIRLLQDLEHSFWIGPYNDSVAFTVSQLRNSFFFGPGYGGQVVLYTGADYIPNRPGKLGLASALVSSKVLVHENNQFTFQYAFSSDTSFSGLYFGGKPLKRAVHGGFISGNYVYFLIRQFNETYAVQGHSLLARVCINDGTFHSYTELPIYCIAENFIYHIATDIALSESGRFGKLFHSDYQVFISFIQYRNRLPIKSVLCTYFMNDLEKKFDKAVKECFNGSLSSHLLKPLSGEFSDCHQEAFEVGNNGFCGTDMNPYIFGPPIKLNVIQISSAPIRQMSVLKQNNNIVGFLAAAGPDLVQKYNFENDTFLVFNYLLQRSNDTTFRHMQLDSAFDKEQHHIYYLVENKVIKYPIHSCSIYETCYACLQFGKNDPLGCGWCDGQCAHQEECVNKESFSTNECSPVIYKVSPLKGSLLGGTVLTIFGTDFGEDLRSSLYLTIADIDCTLFSLANDTIRCVTKQAPAEISGPVKLTLSLKIKRGNFALKGPSFSKQNFSFVKPHLYGIYPSKGPVSGGTNVTLFGKNLDVGRQYLLYIHGRFCQFPKKKEDRIHCTTDTKIHGRLGSGIIIDMDGMRIKPNLSFSFDFGVPLSESFTYLPDPEIYKIDPNIRTMSGKVNVTITGQNLDTVIEPRMLVKVPSSQVTKIFQEPCWVNPDSKGTIMVCTTPELQGSERDTTTSILFDVPLVADLSFLMDGVKEMRDFSEYHEELSHLLYYPNPEYESFREVHEILSDQTELEIKGKYLNLVYTLNHTSVTINDEELCNISSLTSSKLQCILPSNIMVNASFLEKNLSVEVSSGPFQQLLGYMVIKEPEPESNKILTVVLSFVLLGVIAGGAIFCFRRQRQKIKHLENRQIALIHDYQRTFSKQTEPLLKKRDLIDEDTKKILESKNLIVLQEHLSLENQIGAGQFGCVYKGKLHRPNENEICVAVKTIRNLSSQAETADFFKEGLIMKDFKHENVLSLIGVSLEEESPMIILPFMEHGDLRSYLLNEDHVLYVSCLLRFQLHVASGMAYLARYRFVHRDLAARNCVLDKNLTVKVADFGLSRDIYQREYYCAENKRPLPLKWMAIECIEKNKYDEKTDVWSFGVVMWEIMTRGILPYPDIDNRDLMQYLKDDLRLPRPVYCSEQLYGKMLLCWHPDPLKRPNFDALESFLRHQLEKSDKNMKSSAPQFSEEPTVPQNTLYLNYDFKYTA